MSHTLRIKDRLFERQSFTTRALILFLAISLLIFGLVVRLVDLQIVEHEAHSTKSEENRIQIRPIAPPRGLIFDRNGVLLAENKPIYSLDVVVDRVPELPVLIERLRNLIKLTDDDLEGFAKRVKRRSRPFEAVPLKLNLAEEEIAVLAVNRHRLPGVETNTAQARHYPYGGLLSHALGSVRRINVDDLSRLDSVAYSGTAFVGKRGLEKFYESSLHGEVGHQRVETDAHGRTRQVLESVPPIAGQNITLQLDSRLQIAATAALGERRGAVVALDTRSGGILALVSNPGYDPNLFITGMSNDQYKEMTSARNTPLFNRAINGQYAPGSTIKPVVGLAALSSKSLTWSEHIEDKGWFKLPGQERIYRDWSWRRNNSGGQGTVDLRRAIYRSSNVFFYDLATRMDIDDLAQFVEQFGLGQQTAVDIADASSGLFPTRFWKRGAKGEVWYPGDSVNVGIGQGDVLVTPLQLATMTAVIANRGRWVRPQMLLSSDAPLVEAQAPSTIPDVLGPSPDDWENMIDAMEDVVHRGRKGYGNNGTAWAHIGQNISYRMAGKSGTAQVVEIKQGEEYDEEELDEYNRKHAWFIAFAPADDPVIALSVLVENGGGGSSVAGPVARAVMDAYLLPQLAAR